MNLDIMGSGPFGGRSDWLRYFGEGALEPESPTSGGRLAPGSEKRLPEGL